MQLEVAYIDDEVDLCEIFSEAFTKAHINISTYTDPNLALKFLAKNPPDLVFIDFRLPNINGDQIALKMDPKIPKALITGDAHVNAQAEFDRIFYKPVDFDQLGQYLESYFNLKVNRQS